jgi:hypothetical protein
MTTIDKMMQGQTKLRDLFITEGYTPSQSLDICCAHIISTAAMTKITMDEFNGMVEEMRRFYESSIKSDEN